ncbi:Conserved_hypothetical protein [Hexamita inflata]|uniref:Uncharacterized protein n=1 Tax=Hexamita inflata TaxID=28002 RepID=A0ABP1GUY3_9EUKA
MSTQQPEIKSFVISEEMEFFKEEYKNCKKVEIKLANMPKLNNIPSSVEQLFAPKCGLTSLKNLRIAVNLTVVDLSDNLLTSIADLRFLTNIQVLNLARNNLIDISPIGELKKIVELNVSGNYAINFLPILNLPNFKPIMISEQKTALDTDFQMFLNPEESVEDAMKRMNAELKLKPFSDYCCMMILRYESKVDKDGTLRIKNDNELTYTTFTDSINVKNLIIENCLNVILEKDDNKTLPKKVTNLSITNCGLTKLDGIEQMTQLLEIDVSNNKLLLIKPLLGIPGLQKVKLDGNYVQDLQVLQELKNNYWPLATEQNIPDQTVLNDYIGHISEQEKVEFTGLMQSQKEKNEQIVYDAFQITKLKDTMKNAELTIQNDNSIISTQFLDFLMSFFKIKKFTLDNCQNVKFIRNPIKIIDLSIVNSKINDLRGLEQMKQLKKLNLSGNSIRNVTAIGSLTELTSLVLNHNDVYNISALKSLEKLTELDLSFNKILFSEPIANLDKITQLNVHKNMLQDLIVIRNMALFTNIDSWALISKQNEPTQQDYELFCENSDLKLESLAQIASQNKVQNAELVYDSEMIQKYKTNNPELTITNDSNLTSIAFMDQMPVTYLTLVNCQNISFTRTPEKLTKFTAVSCKLKQVEGIEKMKQLLQLKLNLNALNDSCLQFIAQLENLEHLNLSQNRLTNVNELKSLKMLKVLDVNQNRILDAGFAQDLTKMENLDISHNQIKSINPLEGLVEIKQLDISQNKICSIAKLEKLKKLEYLNISFNKIIQVEVCKKFEKLTDLVTNENLVQDFYIIASHQNSRKCWETQQSLPTDEDYANAGLSESKNIIENNVTMLEKFQSQVVDSELVIKNDPEVINLVFTDVYKLKKLTVEDCCQGDMDNLTFDMQSTTVEILNIKNCKLQEITDIYNMSQLVELNLSFNNLSNIEELGALEKLQKLNLESNAISRIQYLEDLKQLNYLNISNNKVIICAPLQKLNVQTLFTSNNMIQDQFKLLDLKNFNQNMLQIQLAPTLPDFEYYLGSNSTEKLAQDLMAQTFKDYDDFMTSKYKDSVQSGKFNLQNDLLVQNLEFTEKLNVTDLSIVGCPNVKFDRVPHQELQSLKINNCGIYHVNGIEQIKVSYLDLNNNKCLVIEPVSRISNLQTFSADFNLIQDFEAKPDSEYHQNTPQTIDYQNYLNLTKSTLSVEQFIENIKNRTYNVTYLTELTPNWLKLKYENAVVNNQLTIQNDPEIRDLKFLDQLNVSSVIINNCQNVQFLRAAMKITNLVVNNCGIYHVNGIQQMKQLVSLNLNNNKCIVIEPISQLNLQTFSADYNLIQDLENVKPEFVYYQNTPQTIDYQNYITQTKSTLTVEQLIDSLHSKKVKSDLLINELIQKENAQKQKFQSLITNNQITIQNDPNLKDLKLLDELQITSAQILNCPNIKFTRFSTKITNLVINNCELFNVNGIQQMKQLTYLNLNNNKCVIIEQVAQLTNLTYFCADNNFIQDLNTLKSIQGYPEFITRQNTPQDSDISNYLRSINSLHTVQEFKNATQSNKQQTEALVNETLQYDTKMKNKYQASVSNSKLSISNDVDLKSLRFVDELNVTELNVSSCKNVTFARTPTKVVKLTVNSCELKNANGIEKMKQLQYLNLSSNQITSIQELRTLVNLKELRLNNNQITNIQGIGELRNLNTLYLYSNKIVSIQELKALANLTYLNLYNNQIANIQWLSGLTNLKELYLDSNKIVEITALRDLRNLNKLEIYHNKIFDFSPVQNHPNRGNYHSANWDTNNYQKRPTQQEIEDSRK